MSIWTFPGLIPFTGNKTKLLPTLLEEFKKHSEATAFVDAFGGSLAVSIAVSRHLPSINHILANEFDKDLFGVLQFIADNGLETIDIVEAVIEEWGLGKETQHKEAFFKFRDHANAKEQLEPLDLLVLLLHSFSNLIKINRKGKFSVPYGKRTLNSSSKNRIKMFAETYSKERWTLTNKDFADIEVPNNSLVYCDPPYLVGSDAPYNRFWGSEDDVRLMNWLDALHGRGIPFIMSNVLHHKGETNHKMLEWATGTGYVIKDLSISYSNASYHNNKTDTREVIIYNEQ